MTTLQNTDVLNELNSSNEREELSLTNEFLIGETKIYGDQYQIGRGFNSATNEVKGAAVIYNDESDLTTVSGTDGIFTEIDLKLISSYDQMKSFMGLNISGNAKYGWLKASAKVEKFNQIEWNSYSDFLMAKVIVHNPSKILKEANLDTQPLERLNNDVQDFLEFYGDEYISGLKTGGELYVLFQFNSFTREEKSATSTSISLALGSFAGSAKTTTELNQSLSQLTSTSNMSKKVIRIGDNSSLNYDDTTELLDYIERFPEIVNSLGNKAALLYVFTDDIFSTNNFPVGVPRLAKVSIIEQGEKLNSIFRKMEKIHLANNDLNFIRTNNQRFKSDDVATAEGYLESNEDLQTSLASCVTRCMNSIQHCDDCQELLTSEIRMLNPETLETTPARPNFMLEFSDKIIPNSSNYVEICSIPKGKEAKLEFKGKLLAPNGCFEPFVSSINNDKAGGWQMGGMYYSKAYPVIEIQIIGSDGIKTEALRLSDRVKIIDSKEGDTIVKAGLKVFECGSNNTFPFGIYLTECDASNKPRVDLYMR